MQLYNMANRHSLWQQLKGLTWSQTIGRLKEGQRIISPAEKN